MNTEELLYEYFMLTETLSLPDIGTFRMQRIPPQTDPGSQKMLPPSYKIIFDHRHHAPRRDMYAYVARKSGIEEWQAVKSVNHFSYTLRSCLLHGEPFELSGIGTLLPDNGAGFRFDPRTIQYDFNKDIAAKPISKSDAIKNPLRGFADYTQQSALEESVQGGAERLSPKRTLWFIILLILALIILRVAMGDASVFMSRYNPFTPAKPVPTYITTPKSQ